MAVGRGSRRGWRSGTAAVHPVRSERDVPVHAPRRARLEEVAEDLEEVSLR
ncbi:MAG TPA: hypothetical protein VE225_05625 [Rubrobacteraceae bacterium]|nr:hypothetical protein [Rubrobacteraceae bacterium]